MSLKLCLNRKLNAKLLQHFPVDPHANLQITLQRSNLSLSLTYLSMDSPKLARLPPNLTHLNLSHLPQQPAMRVLRALYGGQLVVTNSQFDDVFMVIQYLEIEEYKLNAEEGIRHWLQKRDGAPNSLEWVQTCMKHHLLQPWLLEWLSEHHLRHLQSTKNYLQLGKLSDISLNQILLHYLKREDAKTVVVNTILQNYFNRKNLNPNHYFQPQHLLPLKQVWDKHHHKYKHLKLQKMNSIGNLMATTISPRQSNSRDYQPKTALRVKKLGGTNMNCVSMHITDDLFKNNQKPITPRMSLNINNRMDQDKLLDIRITVLNNQLQQKSTRIQELQKQLNELQIMKEKKNQRITQDVQIGALKQRMKSRKDKISMIEGRTTRQYALERPIRKVHEHKSPHQPYKPNEEVQEGQEKRSLFSKGTTTVSRKKL